MASSIAAHLATRQLGNSDMHITASVLVPGRSPDDWRRRSPEFNSSKLEKNLALVEQLRVIGKKH